MTQSERRPAVNAFWSDPDAWPFNPAGLTYLPRAALLVGRALFADDWRGTEFGIETPPQLSTPYVSPTRGPQLNLQEYARALDIVRTHDGEPPEVEAARKALAERLGNIAGGPHRPMASPAAARIAADPAALAKALATYTRARQIISDLEADAAPYLARAAAVERQLTAALVGEEIRAVYQHGTQRPTVEPLAWNVRPAVRLARYRTGLFDWRRPTGTEAAPPASPLCPIFIENTGLVAFVATLKDPLEAWAPGKNQTLKHWSAHDGPAEAAAIQRLRDKGNTNPSENQVCGELAKMWNLTAAARGIASTTLGSVKTTRARAG